MPLEPLQADVLGPDYRVETFSLPPDDEGPVVATLVTLEPDRPNGRAVLHVHGFADYFFHDEYAEWWTDRGYTSTPSTCASTAGRCASTRRPTTSATSREYFAELDVAWWRITQRDGHTDVVASGHSTGGLTLPLWVHERRPAELPALVLNSPWFDMQGAAWLRSPAARVALERIGTRRPMRRSRARSTSVYGRSLHRDHDGEWDFDLDWKPLQSWPVYAGWLRAVRRGHARAARRPRRRLPHAGALLGAVVARRADRRDAPRPTTSCSTSQQIRRWASSVGRHVTSVAVEGALHDVVLSRPEVRATAYAALDTWLRAWVATGSSDPVESAQRRSGPTSRRPRPTTTAITARSSGGGRRRPTVAPSWPPTTEPRRDQAGDLPVDVGDGDEDQPRRRR